MIVAMFGRRLLMALVLLAATAAEAPTAPLVQFTVAVMGESGLYDASFRLDCTSGSVQAAAKAFCQVHAPPLFRSDCLEALENKIEAEWPDEVRTLSKGMHAVRGNPAAKRWRSFRR